MSSSYRYHNRIRGRATLIVLLFMVPLAVTMMAGAYVNHPDYKTGAPGEETCQQCHDDYALNSGNGYVALTGVPDRYVPGKTYALTVTVYHPDMTRFGFEITSVAETSGEPAGSFSCVDATQTMVSQGGKYIKSSNNGLMCDVVGMKTWQIQWNSPSKADSAVTFYAAGAACDNDNDEGDDWVYTCMMTISPAPKIPQQPKGLIVEPGDAHVELSWQMIDEPDPQSGPVSYNIYWSASSTGGLSLLTTVSEKTYVHNGLVNCRTYRYQISGANNEGEGPLSDVVRATPDLVPDRPRHLETSKVAYNEIALKWEAPTNWGGAAGHAYSVYRGETSWLMSMIADNVANPSYSDKETLLPNTTYYYRVQAKNDLGVGGVEKMSVYVPPTTPGFPLGLSVSVAYGDVELTWQAPMDEGGDMVRYYTVYRAEEDKEPVLVTDRLTETFLKDTTATADVRYEYTVAAVNVAGEGTLSTPVSAYVAPPPTSGETADVIYEAIPFSGLVAVGAVIIIGAIMLARLSSATNRAERAGKD
jgi:fibronectin type 3 domain-containing protein